MAQRTKTAQERPASGDGVQSFGKEELLQAECLRPYRDAARALLEDGREYTLQEAVSKVDEFMKGKVK